MTSAFVLVVCFVGSTLWRAQRARRRREALMAERLHWLAVRDELAAQTTLRPRTGEVVASVQISPNGYHHADD